MRNKYNTPNASNTIEHVIAPENFPFDHTKFPLRFSYTGIGGDRLICNATWAKRGGARVLFITDAKGKRVSPQYFYNVDKITGILENAPDAKLLA